MGRRRATADLVAELKERWEPLLAMCPTVREGIGAGMLLRATDDAGDVEILVDFPAGEVRAYAGESYGFRFDIARPLVEKVVAERRRRLEQLAVPVVPLPGLARGRVQRVRLQLLEVAVAGRMRRTEAEALRKLHPPTETEPDIELGDWVVQRRCPHRNADLAVFGEIEGCELTCTMHGWRFDLETGECLDARRTTRCGPGAATADATAQVGPSAPCTHTGMPIGIRSVAQMKSIAGSDTRTQPCDAG